MKQLRILGIALVAVFTLGVAAAASASAATSPEFKLCVKVAKNAEKKYTGGYNNKTCTEVNSNKEGKYATEAVKPPIAVAGKSKASTLYYYEPGGAILYTVTCKKDKDAGTIQTSTTLETAPGAPEGGLVVTFEKCEATNLSTKAKAKCASGPVATSEAAVLDLTFPAETTGFGFQANVSAYECGSIKFEPSSGLWEAEVLPTSKGEFAAFKVNKATGESIPRELLYEGSAIGVFSGGEVVEGATHTSVEIGVESTEAITPKKGVVVIP